MRELSTADIQRLEKAGCIVKNGVIYPQPKDRFTRLTINEANNGIGVRGFISYELSEDFGHLKAGEKIVIAYSQDDQGKWCYIYGKRWGDPEGKRLPREDIGTVPIIRNLCKNSRRGDYYQ